MYFQPNCIPATGKLLVPCSSWFSTVKYPTDRQTDQQYSGKWLVG